MTTGKTDQSLTVSRASPEEVPGKEIANKQGRAWLFAAGGIAGAMLASSCCILPLALVMLGLGGAWMSSLTALAPYKPYFLLLTGALLAGGFWHVYGRQQKMCAEGTYCARPASAVLTKSALWLAAVIALLAATVGYWAPLLY